MIVTHQLHFSDWVSIAVEFIEYVSNFICDIGMDDHFSSMIMPIKPTVLHPKIAQIGKGDGAASVPRVATEHAGFDCRAYGADFGRISCEEKPGKGEE